MGEHEDVIAAGLHEKPAFGNKRVNIGVDIYNLFNSDAILAYNTTYNSLVNGVSTLNNNFWTATQLVSPRFQVQFDF